MCSQRTQWPLLLMTQPAVAQNVALSMLIIAQQTGKLPKWALLNGETNGMDGAHAVVMLTDAYFAGIPLNYTQALTDMGVYLFLYRIPCTFSFW